MGHAPRWAPGGVMSYRLASGARVNERNEWGSTGNVTSGEGRHANGRRKKRKLQTRRKASGERARDGMYAEPVLANPGNLIHLRVGGNLMGDSICHENEAPFPEALAEWFVRSLCPPGGVVLDPFSGSGTTACVAHRLGRIGIGIDIRENQCELGRARLACVQREMFA
jgi:DNA modification methylase